MTDVKALQDSMSPEALDEWRAADELDHLIGNRQLIWTVANVGAAACMCQGIDIHPALLVEGAEDLAPTQSLEEQKLIMEQIAERQNASF